MNQFFVIVFLLISSVSFGQSKLDLPGGLQIDLGFNQFIDAPLMNLGSDNKRVSLNFFQSRAINVYYMYEIRLGHDKFTFHPGLGIGSQHYSFNDKIRIENASIADSNGRPILGVTGFGQQGYDIKKSKLATTYLDIPLEFRFRSNTGRKAFRVGLGGKIGYLLNSHRKEKYFSDFYDDNIIDKRNYDFNLNKIRYGVTARVGFRNIDAFVYYNLSEVFDSDKLVSNAIIDSGFGNGEKVNPKMIMFGITLHGL